MSRTFCDLVWCIGPLIVCLLISPQKRYIKKVLVEKRYFSTFMLVTLSQCSCPLYSLLCVLSPVIRNWHYTDSEDRHCLQAANN